MAVDIMKRFILILLVFSITSCATTSGEWSDYLNEMEQTLDLSVNDVSGIKSRSENEKISFLYQALANTSEVYIHGMRGATENKVFLHKDGHNEAVLGPDGKSVTDCVNRASYNYYHPHKEPLLHFTYDIFPWIVWGNCREDPTSRRERISAYMSDLAVGFEKAHDMPVQLEIPSDLDMTEDGRWQAVAFFLKAIEKANQDLDVFVSSDKVDLREAGQFFDDIEKATIEMVGM